MPARKDKFGSDFVVLRYDDEEMRLVAAAT
jgi:hypothetical protein